MLRWSAAALAALCLAGCASGYNKSNLFGGYWNREGPGKLLEVGYSGNGYTRGATVEAYLLYRSAELARARHMEWLSVYPTIADAILDRPVSEASANALGGKPFGKVYVMMRPAQVAGALRTEAVLARYAEVVRTGDPGKAGSGP